MWSEYSLNLTLISSEIKPSASVFEWKQEKNCLWNQTQRLSHIWKWAGFK